MFNKSLPAPQSTSLTVTGNRAPLVMTKGTVPAVIDRELSKLLVAFQAGPSEGQADRNLRMEVFEEAWDGFPSAVVAWSLRYLHLHNKRNPFPPTPQDVHELCHAVAKRWKYRIEQYYLGGRVWGFGCDPFEGPEAKWLLPLGPAPHEAGCFIPWELVLEFLRQLIA